MKISTRGRYALRLTLDIAHHQDDGPVPLADVAVRQDISLKYLEQIARNLVKQGILKSSRGARGGYRLANHISAVTAGDVLRASEGVLTTVVCVNPDLNPCSRFDICDVSEFWVGLDRTITAYVDGISLADFPNKTAPTN